LSRTDYAPADEVMAPSSLVADRYEIRRRLGRGGMGHVYLATQTSVNREVALKTLRRKLHGDRTALRRFYQEARAAAALNHSNIVQVHDFGVDDVSGLPFIAMEYLDGPSLARFIVQEGASTSVARVPWRGPSRDR